MDDNEGVDMGAGIRVMVAMHVDQAKSLARTTGVSVRAASAMLLGPPPSYAVPPRTMGDVLNAFWAAELEAKLPAGG